MTDHIVPWRVVLGLTLPWLLWLLATAALTEAAPGTDPMRHLGDTALAGLVVSPLLTAPVALWIVRRGRDRRRPWYAENRWTFGGFLTAVAMCVAFVAALVAGPVLFLLRGGSEPIALVEPMAGLLLSTILTALPVWFMVAGLLLGPGRSGATASAI